MNSHWKPIWTVISHLNSLLVVVSCWITIDHHSATSLIHSWPYQPLLSQSTNISDVISLIHHHWIRSLPSFHHHFITMKPSTHHFFHHPPATSCHILSASCGTGAGAASTDRFELRTARPDRIQPPPTPSAAPCQRRPLGAKGGLKVRWLSNNDIEGKVSIGKVRWW